MRGRQRSGQRQADVSESRFWDGALGSDPRIVSSHLSVYSLSKTIASTWRKSYTPARMDSDMYLQVFCCSVTKLGLTLCNCMDWGTPGFPVLHYLPEFAQTHVHRVDDAIQPSHPLSSPSLPAFDLSQHQGLFQWVSSSHQVAKVLELQLQHQSFQWIFRIDFL